MEAAKDPEIKKSKTYKKDWIKKNSTSCATIPITKICIKMFDYFLF